MENQKKSATKTILNFGIISGIASIVFTVANYAFGNIYKPHWIVGVISIIASVIIIYFALKEVKESNGGYLNLGESLKTGLGISLISAIIYVIYFFVFVNYIEPNYFSNLLDFQEQIMIDTYPNISDEQLENAIAMSAKMSSFGMIAAISLIMSLFFGFIISLITGLIMKKTEE